MIGSQEEVNLEELIFLSSFSRKAWFSSGVAFDALISDCSFGESWNWEGGRRSDFTGFDEASLTGNLPDMIDCIKIGEQRSAKVLEFGKVLLNKSYYT